MHAVAEGERGSLRLIAHVFKTPEQNQINKSYLLNSGSHEAGLITRNVDSLQFACLLPSFFRSFFPNVQKNEI